MYQDRESLRLQTHIQKDRKVFMILKVYHLYFYLCIMSIPKVSQNRLKCKWVSYWVKSKAKA